MGAELTFQLSCIVPATPQRVFEAMIDPRQVARWWGPEGFTCPAVTLDVRVGGAYRIAMKPREGELFYLVGEYLEVQPPVRLAYTFAGSRPTPMTARQWLGLHSMRAMPEPRWRSPKDHSLQKRDANCTRPGGPTP